MKQLTLKELRKRAPLGEWVVYSEGVGMNRIMAPDSGWAVPIVAAAGSLAALEYIAALHNAAEMVDWDTIDA